MAQGGDSYTRLGRLMAQGGGSYTRLGRLMAQGGGSYTRLGLPSDGTGRRQLHPPGSAV